MDIGKLSVQITASNSGLRAAFNEASAKIGAFVADANQKLTKLAPAPVTNFVTGLGAQLGRFGSLASHALSSIAGPAVSAAVSGVSSMFGGLFSTFASFAAAGGPITAIAAVALAGTAAFFALGQAGISAVGSQAKLAKQLGISTREMLSLGFAAEQSGIGIEQQADLFSNALRRTGQLRQHLAGQLPGSSGPNPVSGTGSNAAEHDQMRQGLQQLGIDARKFANSGFDQQLLMVASAFGGISNASDRAAIAFQLYGKKGQDMMQIVGRGVDELQSKLLAGDSISAFITPDGLAAMEAASKAMKKIGMMFDAIWRSIQMIAGQTIAPFVNEFASLLMDVLKPLQVILSGLFFVIGTIVYAQFIRPLMDAMRILKFFAPIIEGIGDLFKAVWDAAAQIKSAFQPLIDVIADTWKQLTGGVSITESIKAAFQYLVNSVKVAAEVLVGWVQAFTQGIAIIVVLTLGFVAWIVEIFDTVKDFLCEVWSTVSDAFTSAWDGIIQTISDWWDSFMSLFDGVKSVFMGVWNSIAEAFNDVFNGVKAVFSGVMDYIIETVNEVIARVKQMINMIPQSVQTRLGIDISGWKGLALGNAPALPTNTPAGPQAGSSRTADAAMRDSVEAVTAIIKSGAVDTSDPTTSAVQQGNVLLQSANDLLRRVVDALRRRDMVVDM